MSLAKHAWVWNKKFTVKTTTKLARNADGGDAPLYCTPRGVGSVSYLSQHQQVGSWRRRRRGGKVSVRARNAASSSPCHVASVFDEKKEAVEETKPDLAHRKQQQGDDGGRAGETALPQLPSAEDLATMRADFLGGDGAKVALEGAALLKHLVEVGKAQAGAAGPFTLAPSALTDATRVPGCAARVWVDVEADADAHAHVGSSLLSFRGHSDSAVTSGLCALLCKHLSNKYTAEEFITIDESFIKELGLASGLSGGAATNHRFGLFSIFESMKKRVYSKLMQKGEPFPSLMVTKDSLVPKGSYAQAQAKYLRPDESTVSKLADLLQRTETGVVAHFYMDPEVQGVLSRAKNSHWEHIHISDSLIMADKAVEMAQKGCKRICVLGVDFMSENVRATLDHQGYKDIEVYRMDEQMIGCTLAEAAESEAYEKYLDQASQGSAEDAKNALHVVYINTSLKTKAIAQSKVPTITCTSSNVVQTILQSTSQLEGDVDVYYGPDAYMGANIKEMLEQLLQTTDEDVRRIHPAHDLRTISRLLSRFHYFDDGICLVHDLFGASVAQSIEEHYADAFLTAHFEVPGEMFGKALHASHNGDRGVIGSTQNILDFILAKVKLACSHALPGQEKLQFVLGTESGMITSVVNAVQELLREEESQVQVEIVFPVSSEAITTESQTNSPLAGAGFEEMSDISAVVPGAASGEGCSMEGGCASCPYMKINSLDALLSILSRVAKANSSANSDLAKFAPRNYSETIGGRSFAEVGTVPILHMRHFQKHKEMSAELIQDIKTRGR